MRFIAEVLQAYIRMNLSLEQYRDKIEQKLLVLVQQRILFLNKLKTKIRKKFFFSLFCER